ncbi:hypothetical protein [Aeromonas dhakensis]|uniref:hypothetical protein n=1 Tax=Aeromonas dhakensis TaxID=196024 RepID=UPI0035709504
MTSVIPRWPSDVRRPPLMIAGTTEQQAHFGREVDRSLLNTRVLSLQSPAGPQQISITSGALSSLTANLQGMIARSGLNLHIRCPVPGAGSAQRKRRQRSEQ